MKVLAIGCHPDDIEVSCAGTLAKFKQRGDDVTVCHVANGNLGHLVIMPKELAQIRKKEAEAAGEIIGIKIMTCNIGDLLINSAVKEQRDVVVDVIRTVQPDVIITHSPTDYMPDHLETSKLVFDATFAASVAHYMTEVNDIAKLTPLYYMDNLAGLHFIPTEYVDISETIDIKLEMLEKHISQMKWMRDHDNINFAEFVKICARYRGLQSGVMYAEAFTQCYAWPKASTMRMLP